MDIQPLKLSGTIVSILGLILLLIALTGDLIGVGKSPGFGRYHIIGVIFGVLFTLMGVVFILAPEVGTSQNQRSVPPDRENE